MKFTREMTEEAGRRVGLNWKSLIKEHPDFVMHYNVYDWVQDIYNEYKAIEEYKKIKESEWYK